MNRTAKNTTIYFAGTIVMGIFGLFNTMLLTRVLDDPQVYAMYGLLHQFVTTVAMFISFGFDTAYARFYYKHNLTQRAYLMKVLLIPVCLFVAFSLILLEPHQWVIDYIFGVKFSAVSLILLLLYVLFTFIHRFTQLTARMEERALNYVLSNFIGRFGFVIIIFVVFFLWRSVGFTWVLISSLIVSVLATLLNLWVLLRIKNTPNTEGIAVGYKDMLSYGVPIMLNNVMILVMPLIERLIVRDLAGWEVLSIYTAAAVFQTVVLLLLNTIDNIWNPLVFKHCDDPQKFKPIMHNFGMAVSTIVVVGFAFCVLLRRWLVLLLGADYRDVYVIAPAICFGTCYQLVTMVYSAGIHISKKTMHFVVEPIIQLVGSVALCFIFLKAIPLGLVGVGIAVPSSIFICRTYRMAVGLHLYDTGVSEYKMWILMGLCAVVAIASLFFTSLISDIVMFVVLLVSMLVILNKDIVEITQIAKTLLIPKKKSVKEEVQE